MSNMAPELIIIQAGRTERHYWRDLWRYRGLFYFLAWRDLLVRYKQTVLGVAWAVIRPVLTMIVFTVIFGKVAKLPADGVPYPVLVFSALLPWQFFANAFSDAGNSLVNNTSLLSKVYFPRLIMPASAVIVSFVDLMIAGVILAGLMAWYDVLPNWKLLTLPLFGVIGFGAALSAGIWVAALNVRYRDFRHLIPFVVQFGLYISPVGFSTSVVPPDWRLVYSINPMVGVIDGFRWALLGDDASPMYWPAVWMAVGTVAVLLFSAIWFFRRTEKTFADVI